MKSSLKYLTLLAAYCLSFFSNAASADAGMEIVYFECQPNNFVHIKVMLLDNITPILNNRTFDMGDLSHEQREQKCQLSSSIQVIIRLNASEDPQTRDNSNVEVFLNNKPLKRLFFDEPDHSYTYFISKNMDGSAEIIFTTTVVKTEDRTRTHFDPRAE